MNVIGLDLSTTSTGVCLPYGETLTIAPKGDLHARCRLIRNHVAMFNADIYVIEAIGTNRVGTAIAAATVHALVREALSVRSHIQLVMPSPSQLKKWATGKGAGAGTDKVGMARCAQRDGWDAPMTAGDDEADAWWLWTIGKAIALDPVVTLTAYRQDVLGALTEVQP